MSLQRQCKLARVLWGRSLSKVLMQSVRCQGLAAMEVETLFAPLSACLTCHYATSIIFLGVFTSGGPARSLCI